MSDDDIREAIRAFNRTFVEKSEHAVTHGMINNML